MKFKKILSLLTAAAMTLSLGITSVSADTTEETSTAVAKIGETEYTTLAEAFSAAANKATITVIADTDITNASTKLSGARSVTLDLAGHTITAANTANGSIQVQNGATLTLKDSGTTGAIVSETAYVKNKSDKSVIDVQAGSHFIMNGGTIDTVYGSTVAEAANNGNFGVGVWKDASVTINGGTIKAGWYCVASNGQTTASNAAIIINGGELISVADYAIYAPAPKGITTINGGVVNGAAGAVALLNGDLIVNGGTLTSDKTGDTGVWDDGTGNLGKAVVSLKSDYGSINARIHGGTITMAADVEKPLMSVEKPENKNNDLLFAIDGGTFSEDISTTYKDYLDSSATVAANDKGLYAVTVPNAVYMSDFKAYYPSIQAAVDVIPPTSSTHYVITLKRNVNTPTVIKNKKKMTIKLDGYNITASGYNGVFYVENSTVILKNKTTGDATVGGVVTAVEDQSRTMGIWASTGANVTLQQLTYKQTISNPADDHFDLIYANKDAKVTVESGTFESATPKWTLNKYDTDSATITVKGGKFYKYNPAESYTEPKQPTSFVADGYSVTTDGDYFEVSQKPVAVNTATNVEYYSLADAVNAVDAGATATIKLLENVSSGASVSDKKNITLDLNGKTVSAFSGKDGVFVVNDATFTIEGEGKVVARQHMTAVAVDACANAVVNIKGGDFSQILTMPDDSNHYDFIYIDGDNAVVNVSGGTFKAATPTWTLNIKDEFADTSKFNVTGGTFYGYNPAASETEPNGPTSFVADGYVSVDGDGAYTVKERDEDLGNVAVMTHGNGVLTLFAGINFLDYRNAGFIVDFGDGNTETVDTTVVYEQVTDGNETTKTAEDFGTKYIFGAELQLDSSLKDTLKSFTVTPFANVLNKSEQITAAAATKVTISDAE